MLGMGYAGYFGIVWDYINWSKSNDISVGAGRGSGAGSLVAFLLDIVELDPLKYDLLFERFLNPERVSMPDVDTDFESARRDDVISYVKGRFGEKYAAQICTFGTNKAKGSINDAGRVFGKKVTQLSKVIPSRSDITLSEALSESEAFRAFQASGDYDDVFEFAFALEGRVRNVSRHAGGVVISKGLMFKFTGIYYDNKGVSSVMLDMNDAEDVGLVKFDFLGLINLDIKKSTLSSLKEMGIDLDLDKINLNDERVYRFLQKGNTLGIFQLWSGGMRALIKKLKPDSFEDVIALVALFRPGPLNSGMVDNFVDRKHGVEEVSYPDAKYQHEMLKEVLEPTYGIILYQEQVMKIAQVMAGYTLGGADILRRAMGKKKPEEMEKQKSIFVEGSIANNVDKELAEKIFCLVEKFAGYGFNRSHSAVYGLIAYHTLYLKTYYPAVFMSKVLTSDADKHEKLPSLILELSSYGVSMTPPDINLSCGAFVSVDDHTITFGLAAIKGVGMGFCDKLEKERRERGEFVSIIDFAERMYSVGINKPQASALVFSGCFEGIEDYGNCLDYLANTYGFENTKFAISTDDESRSENQKKLCGLSFMLVSQLGEFSEYLSAANCVPIGELEDIPDGRVVLCGGLTSGVKIISTKVTRLVGELRDSTGVVELIGWSDFQEKYAENFKDGELYIIEAKVGSFNDKKQLTLKRCWDKSFVKNRLGSTKSV
jgi:DNA polymerase-3 subunit alpha